MAIKKIKLGKKWLFIGILTATLTATAFVLAQTNTLAPGKSPDFDDNGIVGYSDFFDFAEGFGKTAGQAGYNDKFDLNGDKSVNFDDFFIFADYFGKKFAPIDSIGQNCKEIFSGFNGSSNEKINLVFLSFNYPNTEEFLNKIKPLLDPNDANSFFSFEPIKSNKDKFNLWYVLDADNFPSDDKNFYELTPSDYQKISDLSKKCDLSNKYIAVAANLKKFATETAPGRPILLNDSINANTLTHEFGHSFASLDDEYTYYSSLTDAYLVTPNPEQYVNCDIADSNRACPKWCNGPPKPLADLKSVNCSGNSRSSCESIEGGLCRWLSKTSEITPKFGCYNILDLCTSLTEKNSCYNDFALSCTWVKVTDPYYKSKCIPASGGGMNFNIGTQCKAGTGCYPGCTVANAYRSSQTSLMLNSNSGKEFNNFGQNIICDKIKNVTGSANGVCSQLFELFK